MHAVAPAPKAHCVTTVNTKRMQHGPSAMEDGTAGIHCDEEDFDGRSAYYNLVYCLLQNRWRAMTANEIEMMMGYPMGYTRCIAPSAGVHRLSKGIDLAVLTWVMWSWFAVEGGPDPSGGRGRFKLGDPLTGGQHAHRGKREPSTSGHKRQRQANNTREARVDNKDGAKGGGQ